MSATVLWIKDHRAVFVLPDRQGTVVLLASRGPTPRIAHECTFESIADEASYARKISTRFGCSIVAPPAADVSGEDAA